MRTLKDLTKLVVGCFIPHSIVVIVKAQRSKRRAAADKTSQATFLSEDRKNRHVAEFNHEGAVDFLAKEGLDEQQVRAGSMPEASLAYCAVKLAEVLDTTKPLVGLHVGNFVGVSLGAFTAAARAMHPESFVVAIDPNIPHRGITHPQDKVTKLLNYFGLQNHVLLICGYTMEKSLSNDDRAYTDYDPRAHHKQEHSFEMALSKLKMLSPRRFDFAVIDGNHEEAYLEKELHEIISLLKPGGVLVLDDINVPSYGLQETFKRLTRQPTVRAVGEDGRVGILQLT